MEYCTCWKWVHFGVKFVYVQKRTKEDKLSGQNDFNLQKIMS